VPLRRFALAFELEIAGDSARWGEDEALIVERHVAVVLEVLALLAVPLHQRRTTATSILVHEAHYAPL
jgi:hypothetical protein